MKDLPKKVKQQKNSLNGAMPVKIDLLILEKPLKEANSNLSTYQFCFANR